MSLSQTVQPALEFLVGRDAHGHWLVIERHGLAGGFFASADAAFRYAATGSHHKTTRVAQVDGILDPFGKTCVEIASQCGSRTTS